MFIEKQTVPGKGSVFMLTKYLFKKNSYDVLKVEFLNTFLSVPLP